MELILFIYINICKELCFKIGKIKQGQVWGNGFFLKMDVSF